MASPHHLASAVGLAVLASGGNAMDAAVATNLTLGVVTPYLCGFGGDLFALVWQGGEVHAYNGSGRAPAAATLEAVRAAAPGADLPTFGPHPVTVPGAVEGWFALLERFGSQPFAELARPALRFARGGFVPSASALVRLERARDLYLRSDEWQAVYGRGEPGRPLVQSDLARTIEALCASGPEVYYRGSIGAAIADHLRSLGGLMEHEDLAEHRGDWIEPLRTRYRAVEVLELPPNTQGVAVLEALNIVQELGSLPPDGAGRQHLLIEAMKLALADRDEFVTDPAAMRIAPGAPSSPGWAAERARLIDPTRAGAPPPGRPQLGGTAYVCAPTGTGCA